MRIEVDQSGRLEYPGPCVIAFSNKEKGSVYIAHGTKTRVFAYYKQKHYTEKRAKIRFFSASLALLFKMIKHKPEMVIIDKEFEGYDRDIKLLLKNRATKHKLKIDPENVELGYVGRESSADKLAREVRSGKREPDLKASFEDLKEFL